MVILAPAGRRDRMLDEEERNLAEAAADYREVLVHDPNNKFAYFDLGVID